VAGEQEVPTKPAKPSIQGTGDRFTDERTLAPARPDEIVAEIQKGIAMVERKLALLSGRRPPESLEEFQLLAKLLSTRVTNRRKRLRTKQREAWCIVGLTLLVGVTMTFVWAPAADQALWQLGVGLVGGAAVGAVFVALEDRRGRLGELAAYEQIQHEQVLQTLTSLQRVASESEQLNPGVASLMQELVLALRPPPPGVSGSKTE
jgi:hypothetical protein